MGLAQETNSATSGSATRAVLTSPRVPKATSRSRFASARSISIKIPPTRTAPTRTATSDRMTSPPKMSSTCTLTTVKQAADSTFAVSPRSISRTTWWGRNKVACSTRTWDSTLTRTPKANNLLIAQRAIASATETGARMPLVSIVSATRSQAGYDADHNHNNFYSKHSHAKTYVETAVNKDVETNNVGTSPRQTSGSTDEMFDNVPNANVYNNGEYVAHYH